MGKPSNRAALVMDRAYESDEPRQLATGPGFTPVVPSKSSRTEPWDYDRKICSRRSEVERLFRRPESCRRVFSRFGKLDDMHPGFGVFVLIFDALRSAKTP